MNHCVRSIIQTYKHDSAIQKSVVKLNVASARLPGRLGDSQHTRSNTGGGGCVGGRG